MNELLAFTIEPGWASVITGGLVALVAIVFHYYGDARWQRKDDAVATVALAKEAMDREVKALQATDAKVERAIAELAETVKTQDTTARADMTALRGEVNKGFQGITEMFNSGMLLLTKEVGILQGRLAGANGVTKSE
jgi:hypothetical protein